MPDLDADEILANLENAPGGGERPMTAEEAPAEEAPQVPQWNGDEWAFETSGKRIVPDSRDAVMKWAQQGYNYSQRVGELNRRAGEWDKQKQDYEGKIKSYSKYDEINAYAEKNPDWWKHVEQQWMTRAQQGVQLDPALAQVLTPLQQELGSIKEVIGQWQASQAEAATKAADTALDQEFSRLASEYPNIDLKSVDESGKPLELAVLEHAKAIGTTSIRAAFRDYLHDKLVTMGRAQAKESAVRTKADQAKRGIIAQTATSTKRPEISPYVKGKSWDELRDEGLREVLGMNA